MKVNLYIKNLSWLFLGKLFTLISKFVAGIYVIRCLGTADYGVFSYCISLFLLADTLASLGMKDILTRDFVQKEENKKRILGTGILLRFAGSLLGFIFIVGMGYLGHSPQEEIFLLFITGLALLPQAVNPIESLYTAHEKPRQFVVPNLIGTVLSTILKIYLIHYNYPLVYFVASIPFEFLVVNTFLTWKFFTNHPGEISWKVDTSYAKKLLKQSWPLSLSIFIGIAFSKIDQIMIKHLLGDEELGIYAVGVKLYEQWLFIGAAIAVTFFPAIIAMREKNMRIYRDGLRKFYTLMILAGFIIAAPLFIFADQIILLLFAEEFLAASPVLQIISFGLILNFLGIAINKYLIVEGFTQFALISASAGLVCNVVLNFILIPRMGIIGGAWATIAASFVAHILTILILPQTRNQSWLILHAFTLTESFKLLKWLKDIKKA